MKELKRIKSILSQTSIFFTLIVVFFYLIANSMISTTLVLEMSGMFMILIFSFILALCNLLFLIKKIPAALRALLHYIIVAAVVIITFFYFSTDTATVKGALIIAFALAIIYAIGGAVTFLITSKLNKEKGKDDEYKPQFSAITSKNTKHK